MKAYNITQLIAELKSDNVLVLLRLRQSLLRSITIDLSKKYRDVDSMYGHVD